MIQVFFWLLASAVIFGVVRLVLEIKKVSAPLKGTLKTESDIDDEDNLIEKEVVVYDSSYRIKLLLSYLTSYYIKMFLGIFLGVIAYQIFINLIFG